MVNYQSRAQVPAPCVGKAQRRPVLQVSTIQTPGEWGGPPGRGRGRGVPLPAGPLAQFRAFCSAARAASLECRPRSLGLAGWGRGWGRAGAYSTLFMGFIRWREESGRFGASAQPRLSFKAEGAEGGHGRLELPSGGERGAGEGAFCPRVMLLGPPGICLDLT